MNPSQKLDRFFSSEIRFLENPAEMVEIQGQSRFKIASAVTLIIGILYSKRLYNQEADAKRRILAPPPVFHGGSTGGKFTCGKTRKGVHKRMAASPS